MRRCAPLLLLALAGCAADRPTGEEAGRAMATRMEAASSRAVKVREIHALDLAACVPALGAEGVHCQVSMDVSFELDGSLQRSKDLGPMRFVREGGEWKAYPVETAAAP
jgi:hypothetical protein